MRAAPQDTMLSDEEWAQIASDVMHRTGLSPYGQDDDAVRWVAIRHGDDHIHIVAMLARQDGRRPGVHNDRYRVREACLAAEQRYGLRRTAPGHRTAARQPGRAETGKASRQGLAEAPRVTLRRQVSLAAASAAREQEFFARLRQCGVLVRARSSARNPGHLTGYAVALPGDTTRAGSPVWYGGGKLAADLTLPKLGHRWGAPGSRTDDPFTAAERAAAWEHAACVAEGASCQIRMLTAANPADAADAAWAAADLLHVAAAALGSRILRQAADAYDRAARAPYGRIPARTPAGTSLRRAARLLAAYGYITSDPSFRPIVLITRLAALAEAVAVLRQAQQRAAQAASALGAAERLHAAGRAYTAHATEDRLTARSAALAGAGFPVLPGPILDDAPAPAPTAPQAAPSPTPAKPRRS